MHYAGKVFVVSAGPNRRNSLEVQLRSLGYAIRTFDSDIALFPLPIDDEPGCVVADLSSGDIDGLSLQRSLLRLASPLRLVAVAGPDNLGVAVALMNQGATIVVASPWRADDLADAVATAIELSAEACRDRVAVRDFHDRLAQLSDDEQAVMSGMIAGKPIKLLARELDVSMRTIERRRRTVLTRLRADSIGHLGMMLARYEAGRPPGGTVALPGSQQRVC